MDVEIRFAPTGFFSGFTIRNIVRQDELKTTIPATIDMREQPASR